MGCCIASNNQTLDYKNTDTGLEADKVKDKTPPKSNENLEADLTNISNTEEEYISFWDGGEPNEKAWNLSKKQRAESYWTCRSDEADFNKNSWDSDLDDNNKEQKLEVTAYLSTELNINKTPPGHQNALEHEEREEIDSLEDVDELINDEYKYEFEEEKSEDEGWVNRRRSLSYGDLIRRNNARNPASHQFIIRKSKHGKEGEENTPSVYDFTFPAKYQYSTEKTELAKDYIKRRLDKLDMETKGWQPMIDTENIQMHTKYDEQFGLPIGKMSFYFDGNKFTYDDIMDVIFNPKTRNAWDKHILEYYIIEELSSIMHTYYMALKFPFPFQNRQFIEKRAKFQDGDNLYIFYSSVPLGTYPNCVKGKRVEGVTHFGGCILSRVGNRIKFFGICITDPKVRDSLFVYIVKMVPKWVIKSFLPSEAKKSYRQILKALNGVNDMSTISAPVIKTSKLWK